MPAVPLHSPTLASALSRHWPKLLEAVLLALLLVQLARFAWPFFTPPKAPAIASLPAQIPNLAGHDPFFGGVTSNAAASDNLDGWRVFGLRTGNGDSAAILGKDKDQQGAYRIGDTLAPGLKLAAIAEDHVLLESGGVQRKLEFPAGATALVGHTVAAALPSSPAPAAPVTLNANEVNPSQLLSEAGLQAVTENGLVAGYTLLPRGNNALLQAAGLKPGDVLLQINGQALSAESLQEMSEQLKSNPRATFTVRRDGETRTLTLGNGTP